YSWDPWYRFGDINKIVAIVAEDFLRSSPFGDTPIRELEEVASNLYSKYGLEELHHTAYYPNLFRLRNWKTSQLVTAYRPKLLRILKRELTLPQVKKLLPSLEGRLISIHQYTIKGIEVNICDAQFPPSFADHPETARQILKILIDIAQIAQTNNRKIDVAEIDYRLFGMDDKTLEHHWRQTCVAQKV
ncbi:MAG TPA: hypothetical protein VGK34_01075, partial [Armatimonadota bacterium]